MKKVYAETSLADSCSYIAGFTNGKIKESENAVSYLPGMPGFTWYNRTVITGDFEEAPETILASISDFNSSKELVKKLKSFGYGKMVDQAGMYMDLADYTGIESRASEDGAAVEIIDPSEIKEWIACDSAGFEKPEEEIFNLLADAPDFHYYACRKDGKMVGTIMLYIVDGNAGIHEVSVLPEYRGKGYGRLLVNSALTDAKKAGAKFASLQASALGEPLYKSIGFETVSTITTYVKMPE